MLSLVQESGESHSVVKEEEEEDEGIFTSEHFELRNIMFSLLRPKVKCFKCFVFLKEMNAFIHQ